MIAIIIGVTLKIFSKLEDLTSFYFARSLPLDLGIYKRLTPKYYLIAKSKCDLYNLKVENV